MAERTDRLKRNLDELKQALGAAEAIDRHTLDELRETLDAIDRQLDRIGASAPEAQPGTMVDRLTGGAYRLEASHPDLALALHRIAESLSEVGI